MAKPKPDLPSADEMRAVVDDSGCLQLRVTPGSKSEGIAIEGGEVFVRVRAQPENGGANEAVRKLLGKALAIAPSQIEQLRGLKHRKKTYKISKVK